jgi:hypothetical protein
MWARTYRLVVRLLVLALLIVPLIAAAQDEETGSNGLFFVDYRHLDGGADGVALIDLDPESPDFGTIVQPRCDAALYHRLRRCAPVRNSPGY